VTTLFSEANELEGSVMGGEVKTVFGAVPAKEFEDGATVAVMFRPESVSLVADYQALRGNEALGEVETSKLFLGSILIHLRIPATIPGTKSAHIHA